MPGGAEAQLGLKTEVTPGTPVTVDTFSPFVSEGVKSNYTRLKTNSLTARRLPAKIIAAGYQVAGPLNFELANTDTATLLHHAFGTVQTTGAGPYVHTYTPDLQDEAFTLQLGRPDSAGTVQPFTYAGCKVAGWSIDNSVGDIATWTADIIGMTETTGTALAAASYTAGWCPFVFTQATVSLDAVSIGTVKSVSLSGDNAIDGRMRMGSDTSLEPLNIGRAAITGTITMDFDDLTEHAKVVSGAEVDIILTWDDGTSDLQITMTAIYNGDTPNVSGQDLLEQTLPFEVYNGTDDASGFTAVLTNGEASAA